MSFLLLLLLLQLLLTITITSTIELWASHNSRFQPKMDEPGTKRKNQMDEPGTKRRKTSPIILFDYSSDDKE